MIEQPQEVRALASIHAPLLVASHAALEMALEGTRPAACEELQSRFRSTLGADISWNLHVEMATKLSGQLDWRPDRNFLAMCPKGTGIAIRLGRCDAIGRPNDSKDREVGSPFANFQQGTPLLFDDAELTPIFAGYSLERTGKDEFDVSIGRVILAKFIDGEHVWSWALDPAIPGEVKSVLDGALGVVEVIPVQIPIERQNRLA